MYLVSIQSQGLPAVPFFYSSSVVNSILAVVVFSLCYVSAFVYFSLFREVFGVSRRSVASIGNQPSTYASVSDVYYTSRFVVIVAPYTSATVVPSHASYEVTFLSLGGTTVSCNSELEMSLQVLLTGEGLPGVPVVGVGARTFEVFTVSSRVRVCVTSVSCGAAAMPSAFLCNPWSAVAKTVTLDAFLPFSII